MLCGDEAYRCFGVGIGCAEAGERAGVARDFRLLSQRTAKPSADAKMRGFGRKHKTGSQFFCWGCVALKSAFAVRTSGLREKRGGLPV